MTPLGLDEARFTQMHADYKAIVAKGRRGHPRHKPIQGRAQQCKAANLLDRLQDYDLSVLGFLVDPNVPFTNKEGERDIRMIKVKQRSPAASAPCRALRSLPEFADTSAHAANRAATFGMPATKSSSVCLSSQMCGLPELKPSHRGTHSSPAFMSLCLQKPLPGVFPT